MKQRNIKWIVALMILIFCIGGGTIAANNENDMAKITYGSEVTTGNTENGDFEEGVETKEEVEVPHEEIEEEIAIVETPAEEILAPKPGTQELTNSQNIESIRPTSDNLPAKSMMIYSFAELKQAIQTGGNGQGITTYYLGANIEGSVGGIKVPAGYGFVLDGTDPSTGIRYTYTEYKSAIYTDTIYYNSNSNITITLQNIDVLGHNYYGTICGVDGYTLNIIYDNVRYTGPQITYSRYGTSTYRNSDIYIGSRDDHIPYSSIQEFGEVRFVRFEGHNIVNHTSSPTYNLLNFRTQGTLTFAEDSTLDLTLVGVMTSAGTTLKTVEFEKNSKVNITQPTASTTGGLFRLNGAGASFTMNPNSELNVERVYVDNTNEPIIYGTILADVSLNNAVINYSHRGNHTENYLISGKSVNLNNGSKINLNVNGNTSMPMLNTATIIFQSKDTEININIGGSQIAYYVIETTTTELRGGTINIEIGGNVNNAIFHSYYITSMSSMNINIDVKGNVTTTVPMFYRATGNFAFNDTNLDVKVNESKAPIMTGATITMNNSTVTYLVPNSISMKPLNFSDFSTMSYSTLNYDVQTFGMATNVEIIPGYKNARLDMDGSTIKVHTNDMKHTLFERTQFTLTNESIIELSIDGNLSVSAFSSTTLPSLGFGGMVDIDVKGDFNASTPMIGKVGTQGTNIVLSRNATIRVRVNNLYSPVLKSGGLYLQMNSKIDIEVAGDSTVPPLDFYQIPTVNTSEYRVVINGTYHGNQPLISKLSGANQDLNIVDSTLIVYVGRISSGQALIANNLNVTNSNFSVIFDQASLGTLGMVQVNSATIKGSNFVLKSNAGNLGPLVHLTNGGFTFNQGNSEKQADLLLYGPTSTGLMKTPNKNVPISIDAQQFNTFSTGGSNSVHNLPTHHYKNDHGESSVFTINLNNYTTEKYSVVRNDFTTSTDNPADTFSLTIEQTKILSAGRLKHEQEEIVANTQNIRGKTNSKGHVRYTYKSGGIEYISDMHAEDDGTYDMTVHPVDGGKVKVEVMSDYLYYGETYVVTDIGSLRFGVMPDVISFENLTIPSRPTQYSRKITTPEIEIIDDRSSGANWKLELVLVDHVYDPLGLRPDLEDVLIYQDVSGTRTLKPGLPLEIARSNTNTNAQETIEWTEDTGVFLLIKDPGRIYTGTNYEAKLQWILTDLGS